MRPFFFTACVCPLFLWLAIASRADAPEYRAFWVDAYHPGYKDAAQVSQLVADVRAAHCNTIIVEVRRRGDAYYNSTLDPKAADIAPGFDPLADIVAKAHDPRLGARLEVHAWMVAFPVWDSDKTNPPPKHALTLHPDWMTKNIDGQTWNYKDYAFDPGHPAVQKYLSDIAMEIVSRYDIDGLQLDYIRYCNNTFGYNEKAVARFNALSGRTGKPDKLDPDWLQFRRDQVTALVRKIYLSAIALKPQIVVSVAGNSYAPGITTIAQWPKGSAYALTLQDWRAWLEEGMIDLVMPMAYFREEKNASAWNTWTTFDKDYAYHRKIVIGQAPYLNTVSNTLLQLHSTRVPSPKGNLASGVALYTYGELSTKNISREKFFKFLTEPTAADRNPLFSQPVPVPSLPWKTHPTKGHLKGFAYGASGHPLDGAKITIFGPIERTVLTDATGFYGAVDLPPGQYDVSAAYGGVEMKTPAQVTVKAGAVETKILVIGK